MKKFTFIVLCLLPALVGYSQPTSNNKWDDPKWSSFAFPEVKFNNKAAHTSGWNTYQRLIPEPERFIQQHALWVAQTLYWSDQDSIPGIKKINYSFEDIPGISAKGGQPPVINIFYSSRWVEKIDSTKGDEQILYETRGVLYHELTHGFQLEPQGIGGYKQGTEFWAFIEGMADAVRFQCGFFPVSNRKAGGNWMDGYQRTGFFLQWLTCKDPDFLRKFNKSTLEVIPWGFDKAIKHVLGSSYSIDGLWQEYQDFLTKG